MVSRDELPRLVERLETDHCHCDTHPRYIGQKCVPCKTAAAIRGLLEQRPISEQVRRLCAANEWIELADEPIYCIAESALPQLDALPVAAPAQAESIRLPTTAAEAELMAKAGMLWLEQNAPSEQPFVLPAREVVGVMVSFSDGHMERLRDVVEELERYRAAPAQETK